MRKEYIKPIISVTKLGYESCLLAGSPSNGQIEGPGGSNNPSETPEREDGKEEARGTNMIWDDWEY